MSWNPTLAIGAPPLFVTVSVCGALATPGCWLVKVRLAGLTLNAAGARPVPLRVTVCVRRASAMVSVPVSAPTCVGAKITLTTQVEWAGNCVAQVPDC